jgi:hypothetical protein
VATSSRIPGNTNIGEKATTVNGINGKVDKWGTNQSDFH